MQNILSEDMLALQSTRMTVTRQKSNGMLRCVFQTRPPPPLDTKNSKNGVMLAMPNRKQLNGLEKGKKSK